jgi:hypothetical protein
MIVRVRFRSGPRIRRQGPKNRHVALAFAALLAPAVLMAYALGLWGLAADLRVASAFGIASGLLSHWQVWLVLAAVLHAGAAILNRYGRRGEFLLWSILLRYVPGSGSRGVETR